MIITLTESERLTLRRFVESSQQEIKELTEEINHATTHDCLLILERLKSQYMGRLDGAMKVLTVLNIQI